MSNKINLDSRRHFIQSIGTAGLLVLSKSSFALASKPPLGRVVIIGGGYAGATAAKYIRMWSLGNIETVVIEKENQFVSCPLSNLVLGGSKSINDLTFGYDLLQKNHGIKWVHDEVTAIDPIKKNVAMKRSTINYDRLIIAPGVDFNYAKLPQLSTAQAQTEIPHAWKAGWQTINLRHQLETMADGGTFVISIPKMPYRCPPGPYERACQVANYFKTHKPKSKIIILDANPDIVSKKGLFVKAWDNMYSGMIDYRPNSEIVKLDVKSKTITTDFETVKADVLNVIPPQLAGKPAQMAGINNIDQRWCEVSFLNYESAVAPYVHVIGDSVSANTCYSYVNDTQAIHVANVYRYDAQKKMMISAEGGGVSANPSDQEGVFADAWAHNIWSDVLT
jgi:sulfide dehydrogenase [flavocytochrome c] flavoprotein chain